MKLFQHLQEFGHEQLVFAQDSNIGYKAIIAIHSTALGPAVGGTRFWNYESEEDAIVDALRLARGMTYKNALAGLQLGGGKSVLIGDNRRTDREVLFRAHGRLIDGLGGRYITAEDVGTSPADMELIHQETRHVAGLASRNGDPSPWTARGVFRGIQAAANYRWGSDDLTGRRIALQGLGNVGTHLARQLHQAGAKLVVTDVSQNRVKRMMAELDVPAVDPADIFSVEADIFVPCALGAVINPETIPQLKVEIVAGAANNQLLDDQSGDELEDRGILYAPDYVVNAGGILSGGVDLVGWTPDFARSKVEAIYQTVREVFEYAERENIATYKAADQLAEQRIALAKTTPPKKARSVPGN
ncbi:MAG TPA: Glu/Leu/Phe/Val dehydrogenase [Acidobacteriota bacterium]|nr:Glu/Leu/Phe/Val dehydrogenase [Acidobacteriota bacterium]HMZ79994.1 Glu/Leu/Phe/Val dehydrogenase [Acidobacteriota bacterium]HNB73497.1 Glu/Leu/Phe/Val dehydrogenase [Acidobacteriota bacterium]HND19322.1 Glu/Leu/Phe/Val dehydrogenase [Acidobacteriota bacterium]HNG95720.1 Glu/Leu/Phe/Val dehydrogenase [Acidobacteriota bacterium]